MLVGVFHFPTDYGIDVGELARELEAREFDSLFVCEHTHIPVSRRTPFPGGGELPKRYSHTHDPFVALAFAAAATRTLRLGTGIALVPQRDPIVTAKSVASLDRTLPGRFVFGIGGGWNAEEMENHGTHYESRFKILRERVLAMQALWTQDKAEFHGEFVAFDPVWLYPKPKQKPYPPILLGGESDHTLRRVVEFGNGWFPRCHARVRSRSRCCPPAPSCSSGRTRSDDLFNNSVQCAGRRGGARVLSESRYSPCAARSAGSRPRRGVARARSECAARARSDMTHGRIHIGERGSVSETDKASEEGGAVLDERLISVVTGAPSSKSFDPATRTRGTC